MLSHESNLLTRLLHVVNLAVGHANNLTWIDSIFHCFYNLFDKKCAVWLNVSIVMQHHTEIRTAWSWNLTHVTRFTFAWQELHRLPFARQMRNLSQTLLCCLVRGFCFWVVRGSSNIVVLSWAPCEALVDQLRLLVEVHTDRKKFDEIQKFTNSQQLFNYSCRWKNE